MIKLIVLILIMSASFTLQAQQLNGTQEYSNPREFGGSKYSIINWNVNYQILFEQDRYYIRLSYPKLTVSPSSLYGTPNKFYSKSDLGISTWPHTDPTPYNFSLELTLIYPDGSYHKTSAAINENSFIESNSKFKNAGVSSFKVASVEKMNYNGAHDQKLDELIAAKKNGASIASKNTSNSDPSNNNPLTQTGTTSNGVPANKSGNDPLAHYNNPSTEKSSFQKGYENGKQISDALTPIIDQWAENNQKKWEEKKEKIEKEIAISRQASFEKYYAKSYNFDVFLKDNIEAANKGDELTQMKLISAASKLYRHKNEIGYSKLPSILPKMDEWLISAFKNNNLDAMNWIGESFLNSDTATAIKILENAASFGSLDAMIQLGVFYGTKSAYVHYDGSKSPIRGDNWEKSLNWFTKAVDNGCPMGMYFLGMIYKYKSLTWDYQKGKDLKYDVKIDKEKAYSYFLKSIKLKDFPTTLFADSYEKEDYNVTVSRFNGKAYLELNHKSRQERWDNEEIYKKWKNDE